MEAEAKKSLQVTVIDMQPITPAVGGGRQRLLGLYHSLGSNIKCTYIGSYDWPGEPYRDNELTPSLREIVIPLSAAHHEAAESLKRTVQGNTVIDIAFADQVHLSNEYLSAARKHASEADVVIFSHPWSYPSVKEVLRKDQVVVYDSQNVESILRYTLFKDVPGSSELISRVTEVEYQICRDADLILACSHEDRLTFSRLYDLDISKIREVPNGIFVNNAKPVDVESKKNLQQDLGCTRDHLAVFLGSNYGPNNQAAKLICTDVARKNHTVDFIIMGGCCDTLDDISIADNVMLLGTVDDDIKSKWLQAADIALNPLISGSGTSIKMFDFFAWGLPTIATRMGARGILSNGQSAVQIVNPENVSDEVHMLISDKSKRESMAKASRKLVEDHYAWENISPKLGHLLVKRSSRSKIERKYFSVVIPSYERHDLLNRLMGCLEIQREKDFEVIVIDQSEESWSGQDKAWGFPLTYIWTSVRGAVKARNTGGFLATGEIIAFTDDDCEPNCDWLKNAREWFQRDSIAGIEGIIKSSKHHDPDWRPVSNVGFEGIGFMTANLMVRNKCFQQLNGFDLAFDDPHFREDTDFGWRLQELGEVPFADDVEVYHPPHKRDVARESHDERGRFFEKDALLLKKHPKKYQELFLAESHWSNTKEFWANFDRGLSKYDIRLPAWVKRYREHG